MSQTVLKWLESYSTQVVYSESSTYFTIKGFTVRYSDHHATGSKYNLSITRTSKTDYVCVGSPLKLMQCLHTPKDVKLFIESYLFALACNKCTNIAKDIANKPQKAKKEKKKLSKVERRNIAHKQHVEEALSYITKMPLECYPVDIATYTEYDLQKMNRMFSSTCLTKKWLNRIQTFYEKYPEWGHTLYNVVDKMLLMCEDAKNLIWTTFIKHVENESKPTTTENL